jgi:hypothetical protein
VRRELERIDVPGEQEARERAWALVQAAYAEREPAPRRRPLLVPALAAAALAVLVTAALSPPGRAVLGDVRDAVLPTRVERSQPALFSLPAPGRVLATSDAGAWIVRQDGSRRMLGSYREASWSPFGRFVAGARRNELAALEPDGDVRWSLARRAVRFPRWTGSLTDTRIAYLTGSRLHVVGGDGKDDVDAGGLPAASPVAPEWRPGSRYVVAYADSRGRVTAYDAEASSLLFRTRPLGEPVALAWSRQGRLAVATRDGLELFSAIGRKLRGVPQRGITALAFAPDGRLAVLRRNDVSIWQPDLRVASSPFRGAGRLDGLAWSPDGEWLLVGWPTADQWLFVRADTRGRIEAVSNVSAQLRSRSFPRIAGWCCAP